MTSTLLKVYRKPLDRAAVKPITSDEVMRHGRLGCRGAAGFTPWPLGLGIPDSPSSDDAMRRVPGGNRDHGRKGTERREGKKEKAHGENEKTSIARLPGITLFGKKKRISEK